MNTPANFKNTSHAGERDYEALLLAHGLVDTIEKHNGNVRLGTAVLAMISSAPGQQAPSANTKEKQDSEKLVSKGEVKRMLKVCDTTLWTWAKRNYLVPVKIGSRVNYRLSDVKRIMEG